MPAVSPQSFPSSWARLASALSAELIDSPRCLLGSQLFLGQAQAVSFPSATWSGLTSQRASVSCLHTHFLHRSSPNSPPAMATRHPRTPKFSTNIYQVTLSHKAPSSSEAVPHPLLYLIGERGAHSPPFKELKKDSQRGWAAARPGANGFEAAPRRRSFFTAAPALCSALKALRLLLSTSGPLQGRHEEQEEKGEPPVRTGQASPAGCGSGKRSGEGSCARSPSCSGQS